MIHRVAYAQQKGAALIVAMVLLLVMTMIGTAGMNQSVQNMRMSIGFRDYNYAFQFADAGLRFAEQIIESAENRTDVATLLQNANISMKDEGDYIDPTYWNDVSLFDSDYPVKIVVHEWREIADNLNIGQESSSIIYYYLIIARSFDPTYQDWLEDGNSETNQQGKSQVILQSSYAVRFDS